MRWAMISPLNRSPSIRPKGGNYSQCRHELEMVRTTTRLSKPHLREGIKWSDGVPFTADDIMFWWGGYCSNTDLTPTPHTLLTRGDN